MGYGLHIWTVFFSLLFYHFFGTKSLAMTGLREEMFWKYFLPCESSLIQKKILCFLNQSLKPLSNKNFWIHHDGSWYCILCSLSVFKKTYSAEFWLSTTSNGDPYKLGWEFTVKINLYLLSSPALSVTSLFKALFLPQVIHM